MKIIKGGVTSPLGFKAAGIKAGIKKSGNKDLALIYSEVPASVAAMFTSNRVKAAPILLSMKNIKGGVARAIIANAGNANACNGAKGMRAAEAVVEKTAEALRVRKEQVLIASTGVIGQPFPTEKVLAGVKNIVGKLSTKGGGDAADAILTTDTFRKEIAVEVKIGGKPFRIAGIAKGSGMINPNLSVPHATMFCFITTDAKIRSKDLLKALVPAIQSSFNMVTVDNDQSTNDTVFAMANGLSGARCQGLGARKFKEALNFVCLFLAKEMARDGEGATKLVEVKVSGAKSVADARLAAKTIAGSNLFKSAVYGCDPNWGRIMAALGYSGVKFNPDIVDVSIGSIKVVKAGGSVPFDAKRAHKYLTGKSVVYSVDLNAGKHSASAYGCDLSYDYVKINAEYHT